ncbi:WbqC family protein [Kineococcus esterisolvens]|uniref:WbqC family protein n=1 Tax=unclassified Kineococcus TaxID=2621656 RepID=UPI003D7EB967
MHRAENFCTSNGGKVIVASHQADLLPYSGFWYKMAKADLFDLKIFDQFVDRGYQRRVKMRGSWASLPVTGKHKYAPICEVRIDPAESPKALAQVIRGRYCGSRNWDKYGPMLVDTILSIQTDRLWHFNVELILLVRDVLGIRTPLSVSVPTEGGGSVGLVSVLKTYGNPTYLSGTGARAYMGDCREFDEAGIPVIWSPHEPVTGDSILSVLMDYDDPMEVVLAEREVATA